MSYATVAEVSAGSTKSFEDAVNKGLDRANDALDHIEGVWVKEMKVLLKDGKVNEYRVDMKLTYVLC